MLQVLTYIMFLCCLYLQQYFLYQSSNGAPEIESWVDVETEERDRNIKGFMKVLKKRTQTLFAKNVMVREKVWRGARFSAVIYRGGATFVLPSRYLLLLLLLQDTSDIG